MSVGSWPYQHGQCPRCRYYSEYVPVRLDDSGYRLLGFCRHPRIAMELFVSEGRPDLSEGSCPMFVAAPASAPPKPAASAERRRTAEP